MSCSLHVELTEALRAHGDDLLSVPAEWRRQLLGGARYGLARHSLRRGAVQVIHCTEWKSDKIGCESRIR